MGIAICLLVSRVERAGGQLVLNGTVMLAILLALVHYMRRGPGKLMVRSLPLLGFLAILAGLMATLRVDDFNGNLIPTRISFRWQPQPDELLDVPEQLAAAKGVDLSLTSDQDFPEFLGPGRTAAIELELSADWDNQPPRQIWYKDAFGAGWSGFAAVNGYAVTLEQRGEHEIVSCYEIQSGELVWTHLEDARHQTAPGGVGPRSTPTIDNGRVYTLGATGILLCLDGANGKLIWKQNLLDIIGTTQEADMQLVQWGRSASPLLDRGRVIVPLGVSKAPDGTVNGGASLIAFDALTGEQLWAKGRHQVSYASPMIAMLDGVRQIVMVCESEVCGHDAETGDPLWEYAWAGNSSANASCSQPIYAGDDRLFVSKGYAHGSALIRVTRSPSSEWQVEEIWHHLTVMKTKFTNAVLYQGHVFGLDDGILSCVRLEDGRRIWKRGRYGHGQVLRVQNRLLVQAESGDIALVELDPTRFTELARFSPLDGKTWNNPCLFGKYLLVRNGHQAACYLMP